MSGTILDLAAPEVSRSPGRFGLDPRLKLLMLIVISVAVLSPRGSIWVPTAVIMVSALLLVCRQWRGLLIFLAILAVELAVTQLLPRVGPHAVLGVLVVSVSYLLRLTIVAAVAACLAAGTRPTELTAALRAMHVPRVVTVPLAVMVRFLPTVVGEARAVRDAMRLRGLGTGPLSLLRSPIASLEYFVVPMIASCLRVAEDLSASALIRGLGSRRRPTAMQSPRFGVGDLAITILAGLLVAATLLRSFT